MSVEMAMPQPWAASPEGLNARKIAAGTAIPAMAASTGMRRCRRSVSSPIASSRRISRPTTKKKNTMRPSLTQWRRSSVSVWSPRRIDSSVDHSSS